MYSDPPTASNRSSHQIWTVAPHGQQRVHSSCGASSFCKVIGSCQVQLWEAGWRKGEKKRRERREVILCLLPQPTHPVEWERPCYHKNSLTCYMWWERRVVSSPTTHSSCGMGKDHKKLHVLCIHSTFLYIIHQKGQISVQKFAATYMQ